MTNFNLSRENATTQALTNEIKALEKKAKIIDTVFGSIIFILTITASIIISMIAR